MTSKTRKLFFPGWFVSIIASIIVRVPIPLEMIPSFVRLRSRRGRRLFLVVMLLLLLILRAAELPDVVQALPFVAADALVTLVVLDLVPPLLLHHVCDRDLVAEASLEEIDALAERLLQHLDLVAGEVGVLRPEVLDAPEGLARQRHAARQELGHAGSWDLAFAGEPARMLTHILLHPHDRGG